ncbi:MAG: hypothetical protein KTR21_12915 [Rhodobacteraceae bacterium]|nr:hypothetical protein [Paracoccaceae bacterium]
MQGDIAAARLGYGFFACFDIAQGHAGGCLACRVHQAKQTDAQRLGVAAAEGFGVGIFWEEVARGRA